MIVVVCPQLSGALFQHLSFCEKEAHKATACDKTTTQNSPGKGGGGQNSVGEPRLQGLAKQLVASTMNDAGEASDAADSDHAHDISDASDAVDASDTANVSISSIPTPGFPSKTAGATRGLRNS